MWSELYPEEALYRRKQPAQPPPRPPRGEPDPESVRPVRQPDRPPVFPSQPRVQVTAYANPQRVAEEMAALARAERLRRAARSDPYLWAACVFGNVAYVPAKTTYAAAAAVTGGLVWTLMGGDRAVAARILVAGFGGDWVLTPERLSGVEALDFSGG